STAPSPSGPSSRQSRPDAAPIAALRHRLAVPAAKVPSPLGNYVKDAYCFLLEHYDRGPGPVEQRDQIFIFGFSRGAYTARVLAGFIRAFGLIEKRNLNLLNYGYRAYKRLGEGGTTGFEEIRLFERMLDPDRPPIRLLGLFDTVSSVIESGRFGPRLRSHAFTKTNTSVEAVRHAVAIDERRTMFNPQLWPTGGQFHHHPLEKSDAKPQDVLEVWFSGTHGDVGGGYPDNQSQLVKVPLKWMIEQAEPFGLHFIRRNVNSMVLGKPQGGSHYVAPDGAVKRKRCGEGTVIACGHSGGPG
ncbi:MAG: DUF2235 domain-containing protein, partial [Methylocystis sp.]